MLHSRHEFAPDVFQNFLDKKIHKYGTEKILKNDCEEFMPVALYRGNISEISSICFV